MDGVQKANSGHPGLPMGCAEIGAYLFGCEMKFNPKDPKWPNRDRFVLSAGHGSMWLYSCLHLAGYRIAIDDLKQFRQLHSITPGHPESHLTEGVETTTGPLGQGVGNGVGIALGMKILGAKFNTDHHSLFTSKVYVLMSDGDAMEGVASEACSLAGHLKLNNLIAIYDYNHITLDGPASQSFSEDVKLRYQGYGWTVKEMNGNDLDDIHRVFSELHQTKQEKPVLIIAHTIIGKGSPHKEGTSKAHGAPLGPDEVKASKEALGIPLEEFYVPQAVQTFFEEKQKEEAKSQEAWKQLFDAWARANPDLLSQYEKMAHEKIPSDIEKIISSVVIEAPVSGRKASQAVINVLADALPELYGGSADLSESDMTMIKKFPLIAPGEFQGRNIKYGIREFGMATIATGLNKTGFILPFIGTFLTFSDYMRNAIRLAALQRVHVIYQFTHDSIFLGEDGPTHQPVEHYMALRAIPNMQVIRPADTHEVKMAWVAALAFKGPTAILLSRQNLPDIAGTDVAFPFSFLMI